MKCNTPSVFILQVCAEDTREVLGDATDTGLLRYVDRMANSGLVRLAYEKLFDIPFNSANKWCACDVCCLVPLFTGCEMP